jgi:phosphoribosylanthranilate isomerase
VVEGPDLLVDAHHPDRYGGTGMPVDPAVVAGVARRWRVLLAGGLSAGSVGQVVTRVRPWGVDVASGIERARGRKDHALLVAFVRAVRAATARETGNGDVRTGEVETGEI